MHSYMQTLSSLFLPSLLLLLLSLLIAPTFSQCCCATAAAAPNTTCGGFSPTTEIKSLWHWKQNSNHAHQSHHTVHAAPVDNSNSGGGGILWIHLGAKKTDHSKQQQGQEENDNDDDYILHPFSGFVENGHVCGILGPSGAGKSTFLASIAGPSFVTTDASSLRGEGHVWHYTSNITCSSTQHDDTARNTYGHDDHDHHDYHYCAPVAPNTVAWLKQHDVFFERLTVQETLDLAVFFELPQLTKDRREEVAGNCLESLGLSKVKLRPVGNPKHETSLSGGELRRLSLALELVSMPHLFCADEPTTGIDSKMSEKVMAAISSLVKERQIPCFCTLHQPRSSVWHLLDSVILMAPGGRICYSGPREKAIHYFACLGFECPDETNPAEYFVDLVSIHPEDPVQATKDSERIEMLADAFAKSNRETTIQLQSFREKAVTTASMKKENALRGQSPAVAVFRVLRRFGALFRRSWRQTIRSKGLNALRLVMSMGTAVLLSQIFPSVAKGPPTTKSVADRICVLSFGVVNMFMVAIMKSIGIFAKEKPVVKREQSRNDYTGLEYIACKALAEIPLDMIFAIAFSSTLKAVTGLAIEWKKLASVFSVMTMAGASLGFWLGSFTKSEESAMATAMPVLILFMVVGIINPSGVNSNATSPFLVGIIKKLSPIAAAIEALCVSEFAGMEFAKSKSIFGVQRFRDLPRMGGLALVKSGNDVLDALGLRSIQYDAVMEYMVALSLLNFGLCWVGLSLTNISWERVQRRCRTFGSRIRGGALFGRGTQGSSSSTSKASDATTRGFNSSSLVVSLKPI